MHRGRKHTPSETNWQQVGGGFPGGGQRVTARNGNSEDGDGGWTEYGVPKVHIPIDVVRFHLSFIL